MAEMWDPSDVDPPHTTGDLAQSQPPQASQGSQASQASQPPGRPPSFPLTLDSFEMFHCGQCRKTFSARGSARTHRRANTCRNAQESPCTTDHVHKPIRLEFDTMAEAQNWLLENQLDRFFSTNTVRNSFRVMRCTQDVRSRLASSKKSKKTYHCDARIFFKQSEVCTCDNHESEWCWNVKQQVLVYGCLEHSHPIERNKIRLSKATKDRAAELLAAGVSSDVVLKEYLAQHEQDPESKPLSYSDVYRIKRMCKLKGYGGKNANDNNASELPNEPVFKGPFFEKRLNQTIIVVDFDGKRLKSEQTELESVLAEVEKAEEKMRSIKDILRADDKSFAEKKLLIESFRLPLANLISTPHNI